MRTIGLLSVVFVCSSLCGWADDTLEFNRDIRPILSANCFQCHGFDAKQRKGELRLDTREGAVAEHDGHSAIRPGQPDASEVWSRIVSSDPDLVMPPPETKRVLTDEQKEILRRWIEQGAAYQKHWAFEPPIRPNIPSVKNSEWAKTPIDAFILRELEARGLEPREEADRATLIRRVSFALTGLPPTRDEVQQYISDTAPNAYELMVDRYLSSPRYGEEQARFWLDVARYADTHGLHLDNEREMWAYRDWVITAMNQNLSFDQFTTWQLAGDLLPNATLDQKVATGFNRCNVTTSEGGALNEEFLYRYAVDRTSTTMQTWMGLTAGCAVCHDHKYDPVTTRDFYSMYAFFYSAADPAMDGNIRNTNPFMKVPTTDQSEALAFARQRLQESEKALREGVAASTWTEPVETAAHQINDSLIDDAFPLGVRTRNTSRNDAVWIVNPEFGTKAGVRALELAYGSQYDLTMELTLIPAVVPENGTLSMWVRVDGHHVPRAFVVQYDDGKSRRAIWGDSSELRNENGKEFGAMPESDQWVQLTIPFESLGTKPGTRLKSLVLIQDGGRVWVDDIRITGSTVPQEDPLSSFRKWWTVSKGGNPAGISGELSKLLTAGPSDSATAEQVLELRRFWQQHVQRISESAFPELRQQVQSGTSAIAAIEDTIPGTFTFADVEKPRDAFVMLRGQYDKPGDKVEPGVPADFPPLLSESGEPLSGRRANRLDLARWFLDARNPLTARVTVNRFWQQVFGTGIVKTSDDFGTRGDLPSHPELLDWLAVEFRESGWDQKALFRTLLTSSTFRQSSAATPELLSLDPENRLLARGPRFRLDAEQVRDNVLYVSGLMDLTMGGRGVLPYQPPDIWEPVGYENSNTRFYLQDHGASLYRRSVYCFMKRTAPPPFMTNFDGPNREQFCTRRERSNTPLQALQLMNDVQHFEAARALAERTLKSGGNTTDDRIRFLISTVLSRDTSPDELHILTAAYEKQKAHYADRREQADRVIRNGESQPDPTLDSVELAAWTIVSNLVLNLDETVTRN